VLILFVCVVLHEFGHALSARYYGVATQDITILPIGGIARLDRMPEKPFQEFVVAIAGPAVNVVISLLLAIFLYIVYSFQFGFEEFEQSELSADILMKMLYYLLYSNIVLAVFNMIPAFPMDGGRVLRALLTMRIGRSKATFIASTLGQIIAVCFVVYALSPLLRKIFSPFTDIGQSLTFIDWQFQPVLALISGFIFYTARNEYKTVRMDEILNHHTISNILRPQYTRLKTGDLIQTAVVEMKKGVETNFLVFDDADILRGVLQDDDIIDAMKNKHYDALVFTYMTHEFKSISLFASIKEAYYTMSHSGQYLMPVMNEETLVGVVDMVTLQNFIKFQEKVE
jgi:Zn-dependent protease